MISWTLFNAMSRTIADVIFRAVSWIFSINFFIYFFFQFRIYIYNKLRGNCPSSDKTVRCFSQTRLIIHWKISRTHCKRRTILHTIRHIIYAWVEISSGMIWYVTELLIKYSEKLKNSNFVGIKFYQLC